MSYRSHHNNALNTAHLEKQVKLCGWVAVSRDHGGVHFIDLRDRWGVTQVVFHPEENKELHAASKALRSEYCIQIEGVVKKRPSGTVNSNLPTGEIEVYASSLNVLSKSKTPPFELETDEKLSEEVRLKHRYLDLRRKEMIKNLLFRNAVIHEMRSYLQSQHFVEIDTPILTKSTPEGARDYLVPSRVNQGEFFALPQSPQLFKQILMVSGYERYFQIAKCFRDEDLRADRQPEFTQLDLEMSFVTEDDIFNTVENTLKSVFEKVVGKPLSTPFQRLNYFDVVERFGTDKPDLRFGLELRDVSASFKNTQLKIFKETLANGGAILSLQVPQAPQFSRKDFDDMIAFAKSCGASGLAYGKITEKGSELDFESPIAKFLTPEELKSLFESLPEKAKAGDVVFFAADKKKKAQSILGAVRLELGRKLSLIDPQALAWAWVNEFPLFQWNEDAKRWDSEHHPFTGPHPDDVSKLGKDNGNVRSLSYDLVLNGNEIASGSIRIHDAVIQQKIFDIIGLDPEESKKRFGFLLRAFDYGPPPHGGMALGVDRFLAILLGRESIRDVIAFPKTQRAICPMTDAPSPVANGALKELGIKVT